MSQDDHVPMDSLSRKYERPSQDASTDNRLSRVYVGNLAYEVSWQDLKDYFSTVGNVVSADVMTIPGGRSKGCGLVQFATQEDALKAIRDLSDTSLMGRRIFVREDRETNARKSFSKSAIFLPYSVHWQDLKDFFRSAGVVIRADIFTDHEGKSKGSGTVVFEDDEQVATAIQMFNGQEMNGRKIEVKENNGPLAGGPRASAFDRYGRGGRMDRGGYDRFRDYPPPRDYGRDYYGGRDYYYYDRYDRLGGYPPPPPRDYYRDYPMRGGDFRDYRDYPPSGPRDFRDDRDFRDGPPMDYPPRDVPKDFSREVQDFNGSAPAPKEYDRENHYGREESRDFGREKSFAADDSREYREPVTRDYRGENDFGKAPVGGRDYGREGYGYDNKRDFAR